MRPDFVDNRNGNTLRSALVNHLKFLRTNKTPAEELWIASAYFNPGGFELLCSETKHVESIRLLLGAEPVPESDLPTRKPGDPTGEEFARRQVVAALRRMDGALVKDRDLLAFDRSTECAILRLLDFLKSGKIEVRRFETQFLHAKAFLFRSESKGFISGSSNLTTAGLRGNLELNLGHYETPLVERVENWYEELWEQAVPFDLAAIYERLLAEYSPYLVYLKVLWHLYHSELELEEDESGHIPVTTFQQHGIWRAQRILSDTGGVLVADSVGLGKTFIAGEIIRKYRDRRQRVLLVCPASVRDGNWSDFLNRFQLLVECVSYEQLANDEQLGGDKRHLRNPVDEYALVVVDEAHNYRNPDTPSRAAILRRLLSGKRRDLLLLSATPVNNSLWDLYHLLRFFVKQDAHLADRGVISIRGRFERAMREDPFSLNPDLLFPVIDATTVKRTRAFIKKHYASDTIRASDGELETIRFPRPVVSTVKYDLEGILPGFFERFQQALMPPIGIPLLRMARYKPELYPADELPSRQDSALVGLLRSGLLKRFESSTYAFSKTTAKMADEHGVFLRALEQGKVVGREFLREWSAADEDTDLDDLLAVTDKVEDASQYNVEALQEDVESDMKLLAELSEDATKVTHERSPKLAALVEELAAIVCEARDKSTDSEDEEQKRKVMIFSSFEDTVDWIEEHLQEAVATDSRLKCYRGRIASVSGRDSRRGVKREDAIYGFCPVSSNAPLGHDEDRFDLLVATDVLAEGLNLQQCRNVINYDLPWNPMRLVQRHGRVDRIASPYPEVYLRTFFPDVQLDTLLNLEGRIRRKLAQAAASVGIEAAPIEEGAVGAQSFAETRKEIEKLHANNPEIFEAGGTASASQTGEEYRQELREALATRKKEIEDLPWRVGAGMVKGSVKGHFFCISVGDRTYLRFVPFGETDPDNTVSELGTCLRIIECTTETPPVLPVEMAEKVYDAWEVARESAFRAWEVETDPLNLQPKVRRLNREVAEFLRRCTPAEVDDQRLTRCLEAVESPWSRREENALREVFGQEFAEPTEKARALVEEIERIGVEPYRAPEPLPPIEPEEVHLICWLAILPEDPGRTNATPSPAPS